MAPSLAQQARFFHGSLASQSRDPLCNSNCTIGNQLTKQRGYFSEPGDFSAKLTVSTGIATGNRLTL